MAATTATANAAQAAAEVPAAARRYAVDVRLYLVLVATGMALAFGLGVAYGPAGGDEYYDHTTERVVSEGQWQVLDHHHLMEPPKQQQVDGQDTEQHEPAGQHLLVDIKGVDSDFLNSEQRLSEAMVDAVKAGGLTLLSYHCHSLIPAGVSCVGVLLESHISFHTWPDEGVITLDLFTCGSSPLLPVVPTIEKLFAVGENCQTQWAHELRGFREEDEHNYLDNQSDLTSWVLSPLEVYKKELVVSVESPYQKIDIWDLIESDDTPSYEDSIRHNLQPGDPRWNTPELASPDRLLFLDGTIQKLSITKPSSIPVMFAHPGPKHVVIVGGGEGATLREVLKHNTIESATMIDIDHMLIDISRKYLPEFSNCTDLKVRADNCFDDEKATIIFEDAQLWFIDRFGPQPTKEAPEYSIDVIIVDALDPEDDISAISDDLYSNANFLSSLISSLSDDGVLVIQVGTAPNVNDPDASHGMYRKRETLTRMLEDNPQVSVILVYEEAHCGFNEPHSFMVACKSAECRSRWYSEIDVVDYQIYERIVRTHSKKRALVHFDGGTQRSYRVPPKAWESVYCRREPTPFECAYRHLDPKKELHDFVVDDKEASSFRIEGKEIDGEMYTKVFATKDIPEGSYIMPHHLASSFLVTDKTLENLKRNTEIEGTGKVVVIEEFLAFIDENGHRSSAAGIGVNVVEIGASFMMRNDTESGTKANVGRWIPPHPTGSRPSYSPVYERHRLSFDVFMVASTDIRKGDELIVDANMWDY